MKTEEMDRFTGEGTLSDADTHLEVETKGLDIWMGSKGHPSESRRWKVYLPRAISHSKASHILMPESSRARSMESRDESEYSALNWLVGARRAKIRMMWGMGRLRPQKSGMFTVHDTQSRTCFSSCYAMVCGGICGGIWRTLWRDAWPKPHPQLQSRV